MSASLLVAIFVSNLPEAIGSATEMRKAGTGERVILRLWGVVAAICVLATVVGYAPPTPRRGMSRPVSTDSPPAPCW